jgi:dTDP-4-dehydrorhamnose reductase
VKHVVLGAAGQLGRELCTRLPGEVVGLTRDRADLTRPEMLRSVLTEQRPHFVINCAAYNFVDRAESEPETAFAVNAWGVRALATICRQLACTLVHFSSDYVFGLESERATPYHETDPPGPVSVYGLSKLAGEYLVRAGCSRHIIIRTCGLYGVWGSGGKGGNFVETMLRLAGQGTPLRVVSDQICTPSYAPDVAEATVRLLATGGQGLYHLTNSGSCSWHEFAAAIFQLAGVKTALTAITSKEFGAAARRPAYCVLASRLPPLRPWRDALASYLKERTTESQRHRERIEKK